jgi:hypothetical protein
VFPLTYFRSLIAIVGAGMNNDQGPGFMVSGGKVVDKRTLTQLFAAIMSFFATAIPLMISMQADPVVEVAARSE